MPNNPSFFTWLDSSKNNQELLIKKIKMFSTQSTILKTFLIKNVFNMLSNSLMQWFYLTFWGSFCKVAFLFTELKCKTFQRCKVSNLEKLCPLFRIIIYLSTLKSPLASLARFTDFVGLRCRFIGLLCRPRLDSKKNKEEGKYFYPFIVPNSLRVHNPAVP